MIQRKAGVRLRALCALAVMLGSIGLGSPAQAGAINITGDVPTRLTGRGMFEGSLEYAFDESTNEGRLLITLRNENPDQNKGYLTALVFNIDSIDPNARALLVDTHGNFRDLKKRNGGPFGNPYQAGVGIGKNFMGGGNPNKGAAPGETITLEFRVLASDAASLDVASFLTGKTNFDFIVRFRGFNGPSGVDIVPVATGSIPGPSALALLAVITAFWPGRSRRIAA